MVPLNELFERALDAVAQLGGNASSLNAILRGDTGCGVELIPHLHELMDTVEQKSEECLQQLDSIATNAEASQADLDKASDAAEQALQAVAKAAPDVTAKAVVPADAAAASLGSAGAGDRADRRPGAPLGPPRPGCYPLDLSARLVRRPGFRG